ncbi:MAG: DUF349 domain-containing protein [Alistipes sp.]|nr:DUF349 domain-containing protein [Alistipes sp.]MBQ6940541.1 DUF349 domain-containing protein [Alistipes sp.]
MATEKINLTAPEELVGTPAEDTQTTSTVAPTEAPTYDNDSTPLATPSMSEEFADEEAALAADEAGLSIGEETAEEQEAEPHSGDDLSGLNEEELVALFAAKIESEPIQTLRPVVEAIKIAFYKQHRSKVDAERKAHLDAGGDAETFTPTPDENEARFKELFAIYREQRDKHIAEMEAAKEDNLKIKLQIIDELKELVNSDETMNTTFARFRELQTRWKETGLVPQQNVKDLWETYNLHVENFYNFIKINKELRDLDLKKNYEVKLALCEQAEALTLDGQIVESFRKLQKLHDEWRETGPVALEYKETLWERFKEASSRINKRHQEHFESIKAEQTKNLALKSELCEKVEAMTEQPTLSRKEWNKLSDELLEIQKVWKTIGYAPKKDNNRIYERFRAACDKFFELKREFYAGVKSEMEHNLALKQELCEQAEALATSEDWKHATDELIALQAKWKQVGPVARRHSDVIWKRFRAACDKFFERKAAHFSSVDSEYVENLKLKQALLAEMKEADIKAGGFEAIKEFQRRWSQIGFVPIKQKDALQKEYKAVVDAMFSTLRSSERDRSMNRFKERVAGMKGGNQLRSERERLYNKVRQMEQDIALLENNIGFFSKSKNAEALIADVREKIERSKRDMAEVIEKIKLIDAEEAAN